MYLINDHTLTTCISYSSRTVLQAFAPRFARVSRAAALNMSDMEMVKSVNGVETCEKRKVDKNGRCPGEAGYYPPNNAAPKDFAEFQREMAAKKVRLSWIHKLFLPSLTYQHSPSPTFIATHQAAAKK